MNFKMEDLVPGAKIEMKGTIFATPYGFLTFGSCKLDGYVAICDYTIVTTVPEGFNVVAEAVKAVDETIELLKDDHHKKLSVLMEKKAELLQISYGGNDILDAEIKHNE